MILSTTDPQVLKKAAMMIKSGGVVAFPTETVYGLGADALNPKAVAKIFEIKNRPYFDPLIVHISDLEDLGKYAELNDLALLLAKHFWPGPLTLVLKKKNIIPDLVTSGLSTVAIRMPAHPVALDLIRISQTPIAAPSANPFGYLSPTTAKHVETQLGDKVEIILDGGPCTTGVESTIIDLSREKPLLLRAGGTPIEEIEKITGLLTMHTKENVPQAPGQLDQHYAPRKPFKILSREEIFKRPELKSSGVLLYQSCAFTGGTQPILTEVLSPSGDLKEAAVNLFAALHRLDESAACAIFAEPLPETGLGLAIMDRLHRAAATHA